MLFWRRYLAFGSSMDYMYEELHVQYPLTIEVCLSTSAPSLFAHFGSRMQIGCAAAPADASVPSYVHGMQSSNEAGYATQVYGPDGLGKTAMGGHPRRHSRRLSSSVREDAGE